MRLGYQWNPDQRQTREVGRAPAVPARVRPVVNPGYRFQRDLLEQVDVSAAWPITRSWSVFARWVYSLREEKSLDQFAGFEYASCCWALRVVTRRFVSSRTGESDTSVACSWNSRACPVSEWPRRFPARCDSWILRAPAEPQP